MIFKIHYFAFNAGLSGVLPLITVFVRKYSDASSTEVGIMLMVLPFVACLTKPFFCALADRHRRYRLYFILALFFTLLGFGMYILVPLFAKSSILHGRVAWYYLVVTTVIGYIAYGVVWSLGDAYAANVAHRTQESFGLIRLWGTIGWGLAGAIIGSISPYLQLPEMLLGLLIFIVTHVFEICLLAWWPNEADFEMGDNKLDVTKNNNDTVIVLAASTICDKTSNQLTKQLASNCLPSNTAPFVVDSAKQRILSNEQQQQQQQRQFDKKELERRQISQLQMIIFRMVARKHRSLYKYLLIFVALGAVYNIHWSYFFLHIERLARDGQAQDFSTLVGMCLVAQAVGETFCFAIAPWVVEKLGRDGAISLNAIAYAVRYFGNGLAIPLVSPYVAILTESLQGINYGIFYYLITDTAFHFALQVDDIIPELYSQGLLDKSADLGAVRTSLRATMQGVFSGAFDGLGFGIGSLVAGLVLEKNDYEHLWCYTGLAAVIIFALHALYELANIFVRRLPDSYERQSNNCIESGG